MSEHRSLTERERVVLAAVVDTGHVKGAATQLGVSESGVYRRVEYARVRCGCGSLLELVYTHHHELEGAITPTTRSERSA